MTHDLFLEQWRVLRLFGLYVFFIILVALIGIAKDKFVCIEMGGYATDYLFEHIINAFGSKLILLNLDTNQASLDLTFILYKIKPKPLY